mgnify:CR=1 FL=1
MCGIVGSVSTKTQAERAWLGIASQSIMHRGPDDRGEWWSKDGRVGFAHRRLSIHVLSEAGHQPMRAPHLGLTLIFNGEIYNFKELAKGLKIGRAHV